MAKKKQDKTAKKYGGKNPFAICHSSVGPKKSKKYERCVMDVKHESTYQRIFNLLTEGFSTGGDPTATGIKAGKAMWARTGTNRTRGILQGEKIANKLAKRDLKSTKKTPGVTKSWRDKSAQRVAGHFRGASMSQHPMYKK